MMNLSQTTGYAIQALGCLNEPGSGYCMITDLARCAHLPKPYLAKIVNALVRQGLVAAKRGYRGGVALARRPEEISLLQVVEAVEGKAWLGECLLGMADCDSWAMCPTHDFWQRMRREITEELRRTSLADVIACKRASCAKNQCCKRTPKTAHVS